MSFLRRNFFTTTLAASIAVTSYAQTETPASPPPATEAATVAPAEPLLTAAQLKGGKYQDGKYRAYLLARYNGDKEARAIIHLFSRKQRGGFVWLTAGAATIGLIASQTGTKTNDAGVTTTFEVTPLGYGILVGLFGGVGIGKLSRFGDEKLYLTLASHDQGQPLPSFVLKKLRPKDRK